MSCRANAVRNYNGFKIAREKKAAVARITLWQFHSCVAPGKTDRDEKERDYNCVNANFVVTTHVLVASI
jgi:hypothetical protein